MLIVMRTDATREQVDAVCALVRELGGDPRPQLDPQPAVAVGGLQIPLPVERIGRLDGVAECIDDATAPRLVGRGRRPQRTVVRVKGESIGAGGLAIIAGPCAVESREQVLRTAEAVAACGVKWFRGGAFKPRTSPYAFQGLGEEGLRLLEEVSSRFNLRIVTEAKDVASLGAVGQVADVIQIGSRNMYNYSLLEAAGRLNRPVLLKRGMSATVHEWFSSAEYLLAAGNGDVILCERGIRTFETVTRNTLDLAGAILARERTHLPVVADPSHAVGVAAAVPAAALAAAAAGLDGVMIEVHPDPRAALSDGPQAVEPETFVRLVERLRRVHAAASGH